MVKQELLEKLETGKEESKRLYLLMKEEDDKIKALKYEIALIESPFKIGDKVANKHEGIMIFSGFEYRYTWNAIGRKIKNNGDLFKNTNHMYGFPDKWELIK